MGTKKSGRRKRNIVLRGVSEARTESMYEIRKVIERKLGISVERSRSREEREGLVVELGSVKNKIEVIKRKGGLRGTGWWVEDDLSEREKRVQKWLRTIKEEETRNGLDVKVGYMKIRVDGIWYVWDGEEGRIKEMTFRNEGEKEK